MLICSILVLQRPPNNLLVAVVSGVRSLPWPVFLSGVTSLPFGPNFLSNVSRVNPRMKFRSVQVIGGLFGEQCPSSRLWLCLVRVVILRRWIRQ